MCGIFGYVGDRTDAPKIVFEGLKTLEYRGYDSWGIAVKVESQSGKLLVEKRVGKLPPTLNSQLSTRILLLDIRAGRLTEEQPRPTPTLILIARAKFLRSTTALLKIGKR